MGFVVPDALPGVFQRRVCLAGSVNSQQCDVRTMEGACYAHTHTTVLLCYLSVSNDEALLASRYPVKISLSIAF